MTSLEYRVRIVGSQINHATHHAPKVIRQSAIDRLHGIDKKVRGSVIIRR